MTGPAKRRPFLPPRWFIVAAWAVHRAMVRWSGGRRGMHGECLDRLLSEMQSVARAFPGASW